MLADLAIRTTAIPGLLLLDLPVRGDNRGWFKESWQRAKMVALGLPDFQPVQNNVSFNEAVGVTRGIHAEPWDKYVSVAAGRIFGAWVDLREGESFGSVVTAELGVDTAIFVPGGVGNAFQTLEPGTVYSYLVNDHWSPQARDSYTFVNLADPTLAIDWPITLAEAELSAADRDHPRLAEVHPVPGKRTLILGGSGQVGQELVRLIPDASHPSSTEVDLSSGDGSEGVDWAQYDTVINAAAYTGVDQAETEQGRRDCWAINVLATARLVEQARLRRLRYLHISSDYVFDGSRKSHNEDEPFSPLGVYGQTKAAADALVSTLPRHHILRTSWVVGSGNNFVRTMVGLAARGISPSVIDDQTGRLTFAADIARGVVHLLAEDAPAGTYNLSCGGSPRSWADIAAQVFEQCGRDPSDIVRVPTAEYGRGKAMAPRPAYSTLILGKIEGTGFVPVDSDTGLARYLSELRSPVGG